MIRLRPEVETAVRTGNCKRSTRGSRSGPGRRRPSRASAAAKAVRAKTTPSPARRPRATRGHVGRLLVLECDSDKLAGQGVTLADDVARAAAMVPGATCRVVRSRSRSGLLADLAAVEREIGAVDTIVIVGHGNVRGLRMAEDLFAGWEAVGRWLEPFAPRRLILVACEGGRWLPCKALFETVPSLREIFGSPLVTTERQAQYTVVLAPVLAAGGRLTADVEMLGKLANFVLTGGIVFHQTRREFERTGSEEGLKWTLIEELLRSVAPQFADAWR